MKSSRIVIFNWRDLGHPKAGGAELSTHILARGLARRGHDVTWFTSRHSGSGPTDNRDDYRVLRRGTEVTCRMHAASWLWAHRCELDIVVDEVNTLPFLSPFIPGHPPVILWMHQLAREVWLAEAPSIIGLMGYHAEPHLLSIYSSVPVVTVSKSSARSIKEIGLKGPIYVAENALQPPAAKGEPRVGRVGFVGRITPSKRIDHIIEALALLSEKFAAELFVIGAGNIEERERLEVLATRLGVRNRVTFTDRLPADERDRCMASLDVLAMSSLREGWGLVVSEAARFGVPSAAYPVAGLVDSIKDGETGLIAAEQTPRALADALATIIGNRSLREKLGRSAMEYIQQFDESRFLSRWEQVLSAVWDVGGVTTDDAE